MLDLPYGRVLCVVRHYYEAVSNQEMHSQGNASYGHTQMTIIWFPFVARIPQSSKTVISAWCQKKGPYRKQLSTRFMVRGLLLLFHIVGSQSSWPFIHLYY